MTLLKFTILSQDELDGETLYIHADDIRRVFPRNKVFKTQSPLIGEIPRSGSLLFILGGQAQTVLEKPEEVVRMVHAADATRSCKCN